jgi:hypothetical protein
MKSYYSKVQNLIGILALAAGMMFFLACNPHAKKQRLEAENPEEKEVIIDALRQSALTLDTIIPNPGIKFKESRKINPEQPPVFLDFTKTSETKDLDVANYFSTVKYVTLKYPFPDKGGFLFDTKIMLYYSQGVSNFGASTQIWLTSENIIAGDAYMGLHCYDLSGNFQYTIASRTELPYFHKKKNEINIQYDSEVGELRNVSVLNDNCLILMAKSNKAQLYFQNMQSQKNYMKRPIYRWGRLDLLSPDSYISYSYFPNDTIQRPIIYSFDMKGDTLCRFMNYNPIPAPGKSNSNSADNSERYYYNGTLTIRQAYNDTIYRLKSASELEPAYILNLGKQKLDIHTALYGDRTGKLVPDKWLEANDFIIFSYRDNNRKSENVHFFYTCYDKKEQKLYELPAKGFVDDYWIKNSLEKGIPFTTERLQTHNSSLCVSYSKAQLGNMIKDKQYASIPAAQQEQIQTLFDGMSEDEFLLMILE